MVFYYQQNDDRHIVARVALRATPISHSDDLELGGVQIRDLREDIYADLANERKLIDDHGDILPETFPLTAAADQGIRLEDYEEKILDFCNNNPNPDYGWNIRDGYKSRNGRNSLTKAMAGVNLEKVFGSTANPKWIKKIEGKSDAEFDFWSSIRFGPLGHE